MGCCSSAKNNRILKSKPVLENIEANKLIHIFCFFTISFIKGPKEVIKTEKNVKLVARIIGAKRVSVPPLKNGGEPLPRLLGSHVVSV